MVPGAQKEVPMLEAQYNQVSSSTLGAHHSASKHMFGNPNSKYDSSADSEQVGWPLPFGRLFDTLFHHLLDQDVLQGGHEAPKRALERGSFLELFFGTSI